MVQLSNIIITSGPLRIEIIEFITNRFRNTDDYVLKNEHSTFKKVGHMHVKAVDYQRDVDFF